jgi:O-methyltransferase
MKILKTTVRAGLGYLGYDIIKKYSQPKLIPVELTDEEVNIARYVRSKKITMVSNERLWATLMACKHAIKEGIPGDFVECGVWRGGNALTAAAIFRLYGVKKKVYLFDTFGGMTAPTDNDIEASSGKHAQNYFDKNQKQTHNEWCYASLEDVKENFREYDLLDENVIFVKGDVTLTLDDDKSLPKEICALRLDTDWYESTKKELEVLYPRLSIGGALMIDDYGHWAGAKKAVDEYFEEKKNRPLLQYSDYTGRMGVKFRE